MSLEAKKGDRTSSKPQHDGDTGFISQGIEVLNVTQNVISDADNYVVCTPCHVAIGLIELATTNVETDERSFFLSYFSRNNIELDIVRMCFFSNMIGRTASMRWIERSTVFRYVNNLIVEKSVHNRLLSIDRPFEYVVTLKGALGFLYVLADITARIAEGQKFSRDIAEEMLAEGICFGGLTGDTSNHRSIIQAILADMARAGVVHVDRGKFELSQKDQRAQKTCEAIVYLFSRIVLRGRDRVDNLLSSFKEAFGVEEIHARSLIELARNTNNFRSARLLLDHLSQVDFPIEEILSDLRDDAADKKDNVARAALACLEAQVTTDERRRMKLNSESWIGLAVFCKNIGLLSKAKDFYLKASEILTEYPEYGNAKVQIANSLECERKIRLREGDYERAIQICSDEETAWTELGRTKEAVYCKCMKLEMQSRATEDIGDSLRASKIMRQCSELASALSKERKLSCLAVSMEFEAQHFRRLGNYNEQAKRFEAAANFYEELKDIKRANRLLGQAYQAKAIDLRQNLTCSFAEIASEFLKAKEKYALAECEEAAKICESDYCRYMGLDAKQNAKYDTATSYFVKGQSILRELAGFFPMNRTRYILSGQYFEAIILETTAEKNMLSRIPRRESLVEQINQFKRVGDIFAQLGDDKHAEINYCLAVILMAVESFHAGDNDRANQLLSGAKQRIPADFTYAMLEDQVSENWQPLRYALHMIEEFNRYSRKIETEKGFSFESRVREILKREYSLYRDIDSKSFIPSDDEVGIVFPDRSPIEIDAFGLREDQRKLHLLIGEVKNQQQPVDTRAIDHFRKKMEFVRRRYSKNAKLESLIGSELEFPLYVSRSGFRSDALDRARSVHLLTIDKDKINAIAAKHGMKSIP